MMFDRQKKTSVGMVGCQVFVTLLGTAFIDARAADRDEARPRAENIDARITPAAAAAADEAIARGLRFLRSTQDDDGGWTERFGPAVTAICARPFVQDARYGADHAVVKRALSNIGRYEQSDGGIYERRQNLANYETSVVLSFLAALDGPAQKERIGRAQKFLADLQFDPNESVDKDHPWYGGAGYNETKRPDLSNTQMMIQALHDSGLPKDHPVYQRAMVFVSRCQMLAATNDQPFARGATDGGFIYTCADGGESKASESSGDVRVPLRSYGSMTYAGFKSLLHCNVERDDPRVQAAYDWIRRHYTLDVNPGMPAARAEQGLYYYYHVFAVALDAWGEPIVRDAKGRPHNWRADLIEKLVALQNQDGSWLNRADRWMEGDANYVTGLTVQTLQLARGRDR